MENRRLETSVPEKRGEFPTTISGFLPSESKSSQTFVQGSIINGRYRIEGIVGEGGMGVVYHVTDLLRPEQPIALKTIRGLATGEYPQIQLFNLNLFKVEFKTMTELHHPNLAAVYDFDAIVGTEDYFFTMELIPHGINILEATENADWKKVVDLLVPLCRVLSYVHSRGIIHFDIKPANVLVSQSDIVKVLDFGIAGLKKLSTGKFVAGSVNYMAPEMAMSGAVIDHRADLYSLGILIYQLLTRFLPFKGSTQSQILEQHQEAPIIWNISAQASLPSWLRTIVERLCAKNPADRFRTANNVIEAINQQGGFSYELETQKTRESYIFSSRFVGREAEFEEVTRFIEGRMRKEAMGNPVLFVSGQSGIGKSRLFHEVRCHSQLARIPFIEGNCYEGRFNEYGAIAELITYLLPLLEAAGQSDLILQFGSELTKIEPQLAQKYSLHPSPSLNKPEAEHLRLREQVSEFFVRVAEVMPYTIYINDLQWAPSGTSDLIYYLAWRIILRERLGEPCPIALLGSFRGDEVEGRPLEKFLARLREENVFRVIELKPLSSKCIGPLLSSMLGVDPLPSAFVERVIHETVGNPYFIEEVMRTLVENGSVYIENGLWATTTKIEQLDFPAKISDVFLRRAALLSPDQRLIVDLLAVGDRPISIEVLAKVAAFPEENLGSLLATLERKQIVQVDGRKFNLSHDRMRETIYASIDALKRRQLHHTLGEAIEEVFKNDLTPQLGALAYHFARAEDHPKTLHYSIAAGNDARDRYANDLATRMYEQALPLLDSSDARQNEIQESLADVYRMGGRYDEAQTLLQKLLSATTADKKKARLHTQMGRVLFERASIVSALDELWCAVELRGEWRPRSRLGMIVAIVGAFLEHLYHRYFPRWIRKSHLTDKTELYIERCSTYEKIAETSFFCDPFAMVLAAFRSLNCGEHVAGDFNALCEIKSGFQAIYANLTFYRVAERYGERAIEMAERLHSDWLRGHILQLKSMVSLFRGRWREAEQAANQAIALLKKGGDYFEITWGYILAIQAYYYLGQLEQAKKFAEEAMEICQRTQVKGYCYFLAQHALVNVHLGEHETAVKEAEQAFQLAQKDSSDAFSLCFTEMILGECLLTVGNLDAAISHIEHVKIMREEKKLIQDWFVGIYPLLARAHLEKLRRDRQLPTKTELKNLKKLVHKGTRFARRHPNFIVPSLRAQAMFSWIKGNKRAAQHSFAEAIKRAEIQGGVLYLAQAHTEAAHAFEEDGEDPVSVETHVTAAKDAFSRCGLSNGAIGRIMKRIP
jgi:serine/threonine protein kinase/tetratricopeptide (TPR) repeat protein